MHVNAFVNGRVVHVGEIDDRTKVFLKQVKRSKHLLRALDAWGIDYNCAVDVVLPQAKYIVVQDTEDKMFYVTRPATFGYYLQEKFHQGDKVLVKHFKGHAPQIFLPRRHWSKYSYAEGDGLMKRMEAEEE